MKKTLMALVAIPLLVAWPEAVLASIQTSVLMDSWGYLSTAEGGIRANAHGWVTFNTSKKRGGTDVTVQLQNAAKSYRYLVTSNHIVLGTLATGQKGNRVLQFHVADVSTLGPWICLWTSDRTVNLLCAQNPFYTSGG